MGKKRMSKSQRFSKKAHEKKKQQKRYRTKKENELIKKREVEKKENKMRSEVEKVMNEGRKNGISYKKSKKNVSDRTHKNNISAVSAMFKELKIYDLNDLNEDRVINYFEEQKEKFEDGDITKGGFITNRIKALQRFYDSAEIARGLSESQKEHLKESAATVKSLTNWKSEKSIVKSKSSSRNLKPGSDEIKSINDLFYYLRKSRPKNKAIKLASDYHRFSVATGSRIEHATNATLKNIKKLGDGKYLYIVRKGEDKTGKARIKIIDDKNDIKFLDRFLAEVEARADKNREAYLFEMKKDGDSISRSKITTNIQDMYRKHFGKFDKTVQRKVRGKDKLYDVDQSFVPHSSRSISIQRDFKRKVVKYQRSKRSFEEDLEEMIKYDNSKGSFKKDVRGAVAYGYEKMKKELGRDLTFIEQSMYLCSVAAGHNRIDVIRDHYFSDEIKLWIKEREKSVLN